MYPRDTLVKGRVRVMLEFGDASPVTEIVSRRLVKDELSTLPSQGPRDSRILSEASRRSASKLSVTEGIRVAS